MLDTWYPALRHSDYHITYKVKPFDVEGDYQDQATAVEPGGDVHGSPDFEPGSKEFNDVMEIAVRMFPENETANLNAAITRLNAGDADDAKQYLDKAGTSADAQNARGVYEMLKGNEKQLVIIWSRQPRQVLLLQKKIYRIYKVIHTVCLGQYSYSLEPGHCPGLGQSPSSGISFLSINIERSSNITY